MVKRIKKGQLSESANYVTKGKAMRKLQLNAKQFHRLCILKGIYPKDPKKKQNHKKTYYHLKDLNFLAHEQLLSKFREIDAWIKKIRKAQTKKDELKKEQLIENTPSYTLHHLIKERYPRFSEAIRDLDDALSLVCLFASCPSNSAYKISAEMIRMSERLWHEFELYLIATRAVRKSFVSIKGIYYEAEIRGQEVTWLVPYEYSQFLPRDVDYSIMLTFLEFYHTLMRFVNFKLYSEVNLEYPPDLSLSIDENLQSVKQNTSEFSIEPEFANEYSSFIEKQKEAEIMRNLFSGLVFALGRETPKFSLELIIRSGGGEIATEESEIVTHQIIDRPLYNPRSDRDYIEPQWVFDSLNFKFRLPVAQYRPGQPLPPHLSPFVDYKEENYIPDRLREVMQMKGQTPELKDEEINERVEMAKTLMTRKIRNLYNRIQGVRRKKLARTEQVIARRQSEEVKIWIQSKEPTI